MAKRKPVKKISDDLQALAADEGAVAVRPVSAYLSKTMIFNLLALVGIFLVVAADSDLIKENPELAGTIGALGAAINMFLRTVTTSPLQIKPPAKDATDVED